MYLDKLVKLLRPPCDVDSDSIEKNVALVEKHLMICFPKDYFQFITTYGSGQINDFISIYSAVNRTAYYEMVKRECQSYCELRAMFPKEYVHRVFPEKKGLFPLGRTDGGCLLWWHVAEDPNEWTIVVYDEGSWEFEEYDMQLCEFIYKYFTCQIDCKGFPASLREEKPPQFMSNKFDFKKYCS